MREERTAGEAALLSPLLREAIVRASCYDEIRLGRWLDRIIRMQ